MRTFRVRPQLFMLLVAAALVLAAVMMADIHDNGGAKLPANGQATHEAKLKPRPQPYTFPAGGRLLLPDYRFVALYGTPGDPALGALGEQDADAAIARVKQLAAVYQPLTAQHILPTLEIITTVASAYPTEAGNYSRAVDAATIQPWITLAAQQGVYVVLDLQPGRSDFLSQAKQYEALLQQPNVGLALDPEWRLAPNQVPLVQIGTVGVQEINQTAAWLADLTMADQLPQKLLLLHQFRTDMIAERAQLDTSRPQLAYVVQMDGQGSQAGKQDTWQAITASPPANVNFGWKNFYDEDHPMLTPEQTMAITPQPWYISYQ